MLQRHTLPVLLLITIFCGISHALEVPPLPFEVVVRSADVVFRGTVVRVESSWVSTESGPAIVTLVTFRVERTLKGKLGAELSLEFLGGRVGEEVLEVVGAPRFEVGQRDVICAQVDDRYVSPITGFNQGRFRINRDGTSGHEYVTTSSGFPVVNGAADSRTRTLSLSPTTGGTRLESFEEEVLRLVQMSSK
jgi:hypothetical protein